MKSSEVPNAASGGEEAYWSVPIETLWRTFESSADGLSSEEAAARQAGLRTGICNDCTRRQTCVYKVSVSACGVEPASPFL